MSLLFICTELDAIYDTIRSFEHYSEDYEIYCQTVRTTWKYTLKRPHAGDKLREPRRLSIHYNIARAAEDEQAFDRQLLALKREAGNQ
jgi:hypothetical protein